MDIGSDVMVIVSIGAPPSCVVVARLLRSRVGSLPTFSTESRPMTKVNPFNFAPSNPAGVDSFGGL